jgi:hypothetical protein
MNGMVSIQNLCYLQVVGQSQFSKEIEEMKNLLHKHIDPQAIHRNEMT